MKLAKINRQTGLRPQEDRRSRGSFAGARCAAGSTVEDSNERAFAECNVQSMTPASFREPGTKKEKPRLANVSATVPSENRESSRTDRPRACSIGRGSARRLERRFAVPQRGSDTFAPLFVSKGITPREKNMKTKTASFTLLLNLFFCLSCPAQNYPAPFRDDIDPHLTLIGADARNAIILIHGWNPPDPFRAGRVAENKYVEEPEWSSLRNALFDRLKGGDWKVILYHWEQDAATGFVDLNGANGGVIPDAVRNATEAAKRADAWHGPHLAEQLNDAAPNLRQVHLIAHSAGSWLARKAAIRLLELNPYLTVQVTLLDAYIPGSLPVSLRPVTSLDVNAMNSLATDAHNDRIYRLESYHSDSIQDLALTGVNNTYPWRSGIDINRIVNHVNITPTLNCYEDHGGPIQFYADTITATASGASPSACLLYASSAPLNSYQFSDYGWFKSVFYQGPFLPRITVQPQQPASPVSVGAIATLVVTATSSQPLSYQWFKDGHSISGATSASYSFATSTSSGGDYVVEVSNRNGFVFSDSARISINPATGGGGTDGDEPNDSSTQATALASGVATAGYISTPTDVDWFKIVVTATGTLTFNLTVPAGKNYDIELYGGANLGFIKGSYGDTGTTESISYKATTTGTYYVRVYGYPIGNGSFSTTAAYSLTATSNATGTAVTITTSSPLPAGTVGSLYSQTFQATGGGALVWSAASGTLPPGLGLNGATLSGTPTTAGNYSFRMKVAGANGLYSETDFSLTISSAVPRPAISNLSPLSVANGWTAFTLTVNGTGFVTGSQVEFNGQTRNTRYLSSTRLEAEILAADVVTASSYSIVVVNPNPGGRSGVAWFTVVSGPVNPVPRITSLQPDRKDAGSGQFTLAVNGRDMRNVGQILWNGQPRPTSWVNFDTVTTIITAADIAAPAVVQVGFSNPPPGGGQSGTLPFTISRGTGRIAVSPTSVALTVISGTTTSADQQLRIANAAAGSLEWSLSVTGSGDLSWLSVTPQNGSAPSDVTIRMNPVGLAPGTYRASLNIASGDADNSPVVVPLSLTVTASSGNDLEWTTKRPMPQAREWGAAAVLNNRIYVIGGNALSNFAFDPATDMWERRADPSDGSFEGAAAAWNGKIYKAYNGGFTRTVEAYDPATDTWANETSYPDPLRRRGVAMVVAGGKMYLIGGTDASLDAIPTVDEYDFNSKTWRTRAAMPTARGFTVAAVYQDRFIYVAGGLDDANSNYALRALEVFDTVANSWTHLPPMSTARFGAMGGFISGRFYVVGGYGTHTELLNGVEEFDTAALAWTSRNPMVSARAGVVGGIVNDRIYAIGGHDAVGTSSRVEEGTVAVVVGAPKISLPSTSLSLVGAVGGAPATQVFRVSNGGGGELNWTASANTSSGGSWLRVTPSSGTAQANVTVTADPSTLPAGTYNGSLTIEASGASNSSLLVPVTFSVGAVTGLNIQWSASTSLPASSNPVTVVANGRLHVFNVGNRLGHYEFDHVTGQWLRRADVPGCGVDEDGTAATLGTKIYVLFSLCADDYRLKVYDSATDSWTRSAPLEISSGARMAEANGRLYVFGGVGQNGATFEYDPSADRWTPKTAMPTPRSFMNALTIGGRVYVVAGIVESAGGQRSRSVEVYDPVTDSWTTGLAGMRDARVANAAITYLGKIYVMGGNTGGLGDDRLSSVEEYDPASRQWTVKNPLSSGRYSISAEVVNNAVYVIGGGSTGRLVEKGTFVATMPASLRINGDFAQSTTVGQLFPNYIKVVVLDSAGNPVPNVAVTFAAPPSGPSGTFANGTSSIVVMTSAPYGEATVWDIRANTIVGSFRVTASVTGVGQTAMFEMRNTLAVSENTFELKGLFAESVVVRRMQISGSTLYVLKGSNPLRIAAYDLTTGQETYSIALDAYPNGGANDFCVAGDRAYVPINLGSNSQLAVLDLVNRRIVTYLAAGSNPFACVVVGRRLYVSNSVTYTDGHPSTVRIFDLDTNSLIGTIPVRSPSRMVVDQASNRLFVTSGDQKSITAIDLGSNAVVGSTVFPSAPVSILGFGGEVWVSFDSNDSAGVLAAMNASTLSVRMYVSGNRNVYRMASLAGRILTTGSTPGANYSVQVIDPAAGTVTQRMPFPDEPTDIAVDEVRSRVLVATGQSIKIVGLSAPASISISGRVLTNGQGVTDATVTLAGAGNRTAQTDASGAYSFSGLMPGSYTLSAVKGGFAITPALIVATIGTTSLGNQDFVAVLQVQPSITWASPVPIVYGTALSATQLSATANVAGTFDYSPASGTVLAAGTGRPLSVTFTPTDTATYTTASKTVTIDVLRATPVVTWENPGSLVYGNALSAAELNATADVAGSFVYTPVSGTVLSAGTEQTLSVVFTPIDTANYTTVTKPVTIDVTIRQNVVPVVSLTSPQDGSTFVAPAGVTLTASANDSDGSISKVEFFQGQTKVGEASP